MGQPIFESYDREALDREYDNQAKVPDWADSRARLAADSETVRATFACRLDQAYGPHPRQRLDVFLPPAGRPAPIHIFIHGGYWQRNDKSGSSYVARTVVGAGGAAVVINYGLIPAVSMDELVQHCRAAVAWVYRNAGSFGGDPDRITVSGPSAGGHLAVMLLATDWAALGLSANAVKAACGISGIYDLEPVRLCFLNDVLQLTEETARRNSPISLPAPSSGHLLLAVGGLEGPEFHRQAKALAAAWRTGGLQCDIVDLLEQEHFSMAAQLGDPDSVLSRAIVAQMNGV